MTTDELEVSRMLDEGCPNDDMPQHEESRASRWVSDQIAAAKEAINDRHWSETLGDWYYVGSVSDHWDHIRHDVEAEDLTAEVAGMHLLCREWSNRPAPTTREGWAVLAATVDGWDDDAEPVCVGRVVDGMCVPIGNDDEEGEE